MQLGFGLYSHQLDSEHFSFAKQAGATHLVVHLVDYFYKGPKGGQKEGHSLTDNQPIGDREGWGLAGKNQEIWQLSRLQEIKRRIQDAGLVWYAIENFDPIDWYDILLQGHAKQKQIDYIKKIIETVGQVGIPVIGYNFSIAGVADRVTGPFARGGATSVGMRGLPDETPIPLGMVWNMVYDTKAPLGTLTSITHNELWKRLEDFLHAVLPVAEASGVRLAAHPDDPPLPFIRKQPRLVYESWMYQKLLDINKSPSNQLEFCLGTLAEMQNSNIYEAVDTYSRQNKIAYIHFRNVRGVVPNYHETFIDEGDINMLTVLRILKKNNYKGILIPDHCPQMSCAAPWHAGMAFAMGYMIAAMKIIQEEKNDTV